MKAALQQQLGVDPVAVDRALGAPGVEPNHFVPIITVSQARYTQVEPVIYPLPGTRFRDTTTRTTPSLGFAEHVIGRTGEITAEGLEELGRHPEGDLVGLTGIEAAYETQLAGTPSGDIQLTDSEGEVVEVLDRIEGRSHSPWRPSLDRTARRRPSRHFPPPTGRPAPSWSTARATRAVASRPLDEFNRALSGIPAGLDVQGGDHRRPPRQRRHPGHARRVRPDDQRRGPGVQELRELQPRHGAVRPRLRRVVQHRIHQRLGRRARRRPGGCGRELRVQHRLLGRAEHVRGQLSTPADATEHAAAPIGRGRVRRGEPAYMATVAAAVIDGTWDAPVLLPDPPAGDDADADAGATTTSDPVAEADQTTTTAGRRASPRRPRAPRRGPSPARCRTGPPRHCSA